MAARPAYVWTGSVWEPIGPTVSTPPTYVQATAPSSPTTGTVWVDTSTQLPSTGSGAIGGGSDQLFYTNGQTMTTDYTIPTGKNAGTFGPITINSGVTLTVPSGSTWTVV